MGVVGQVWKASQDFALATGEGAKYASPHPIAQYTGCSQAETEHAAGGAAGTQLVWMVTHGVQELLPSGPTLAVQSALPDMSARSSLVHASACTKPWCAAGRRATSSPDITLRVGASGGDGH